jgi:metal iron transporter
MPHGLFLGSNLATQDRVSQPPKPLPTPADARRPSFFQRLQRFWRSIIYFSRSEHDNEKDYTTRHGLRQNNSIEFIRAHIGHGTADLVLSLFGLAVPINSAYVPPSMLLSLLDAEGPGYWFWPLLCSTRPTATTQSDWSPCIP